MDLTHPIRAVIPTLEGPVLEVLARTVRPLTGLEVHGLTRTGSPNGVRLALSRLAEQGVVTAERRAAAVFYLGNRDHLAWPAVEVLAGLRSTLLDRLRVELDGWDIEPTHASLFGSLARGDGGSGSDIDILLLRPERVGEDEAPWAEQVDALRATVRAWTGNDCQAYQLDLAGLADHARAGDPLVAEWVRDGIALAGHDLRTILREVPGARTVR